MKYIGLIDDREKTRTSLKRSMMLPLKGDIQEWDIIDIEPFISIDDYPSWILDKEISVLIIDEKLNESFIVDYYGHDVVNRLRESFPELPIFCITAAKRDEDLNQNFKKYNLILSKSDFENNPNEWVNLFVKSGSDFYEKYARKKNRLSELATIIAKSDGNVPQEVKEEVEEIQEFLELTHKVENISTEMWIKDFEEKISQFDEILKKIKEKLEG